jgi:hypothetical protein
MTAMHEGVIRDRPALPATSEHHRLGCHTSTMFHCLLHTSLRLSLGRRRGIAEVPLLFGVQGGVNWDVVQGHDCDMFSHGEVEL